MKRARRSKTSPSEPVVIQPGREARLARRGEGQGRPARGDFQRNVFDRPGERQSGRRRQRRQPERRRGAADARAMVSAGRRRPIARAAGLHPGRVSPADCGDPRGLTQHRQRPGCLHPTGGRSMMGWRCACSVNSSKPCFRFSQTACLPALRLEGRALSLRSRRYSLRSPHCLPALCVEGSAEARRLSFPSLRSGQ